MADAIIGDPDRAFMASVAPAEAVSIEHSMPGARAPVRPGGRAAPHEEIVMSTLESSDQTACVELNAEAFFASPLFGGLRPAVGVGVGAQLVHCGLAHSHLYSVHLELDSVLGGGGGFSA